MNKQVLVTVGKYGLGLGLLAFVIWQYWAPESGPGLRDVWEYPQGLRALPYLVAASIYMVSALLTFFRWYMLVRAQDLPFTPTNALRLGLIGFFLSTFLPGSIGGDAVKAYCIAREQSRRTVAVATVIVDRAMGLWALFWLVALFGSAFWLWGDPAITTEPKLQGIIIASLVTIGWTTVAWLLLGFLPPHRADRFAGRLERIPRIGHSLAEFWRAVWMYRCQRMAIVYSLLISLVGHVGFVLTFFYAAQTFVPAGPPVPIPSLTQHFLIVPIGLTVEAGFPAPGGLGAGEAVFAWLYEQLKFSGSSGALGCFMKRTITWVLAFIGYLVYLRMRPKVAASKEMMAAEETSDVPLDAPAPAA